MDKQNSQKSAEESTQSTNLHGSLQQSTPPENDKPASNFISEFVCFANECQIFFI